MKGDDEMTKEKAVEVPKDQIVDNSKVHIENLEKERSAAIKQKAVVQERVDLIKKERELLLKNNKIALASFVLLKPTWKFEENEEYMNNLKELNRLNAEKKQIEINDVLDKFAGLVKNLDEQIKGHTEALERKRGEQK